MNKKAENLQKDNERLTAFVEKGSLSLESLQQKDIEPVESPQEDSTEQTDSYEDKFILLKVKILTKRPQMALKGEKKKTKKDGIFSRLKKLFH